jgi:glycopeptide antibiotics resistance protein
MLKLIITDVAETFVYLPYGIITGLLFYLVMRGVNARRHQKGKKHLPAVAYSLLLAYLIIVLCITFFSRENGSRNHSVDLSILSSLGINDRNDAFVLENVLLFIPYGFFLPLSFPFARDMFLGGASFFLTSLSIEYLQLITKRGYFQMDDILANIFGAFVGLFLFSGCRVLYLLCRKIVYALR